MLESPAFLEVISEKDGKQVKMRYCMGGFCTNYLSRKVTEFSSLQILQSGCNPRHLNSRAFLDCSGLHLDYMDYKVIKWIAEQYNPKQSKGNLCNPSAIHCNLGLQFCFAIQINLCNLTAIQEDCSLIAEIAVRLLRLQKFRNLHIHIPAPNKVSGMLLGVLF